MILSTILTSEETSDETSDETSEEVISEISLDVTTEVSFEVISVLLEGSTVFSSEVNSLVFVLVASTAVEFNAAEMLLVVHPVNAMVADMSTIMIFLFLMLLLSRD